MSKIITVKRNSGKPQSEIKLSTNPERSLVKYVEPGSQPTKKKKEKTVKTVVEKTNALNQIGMGEFASLQPHTKNFIDYFGDPWRNGSVFCPVMPTDNNTPYHFKCTLQGKTNKNGIGWVTFYPAAFCAAGKSVVYTNGAGASDQIQSIPTNGDELWGESDSPINGNDYFEPGGNGGFRQLRIVSAGVRVRYTGKVIDGSGRVYCFQTNPTTQSVAGFVPDEIQLVRGFKEYTFNTDYQGVIRKPNDIVDFAFLDRDPNTLIFKPHNQAANDPVKTNKSQDNIPTMACYIVGTPEVTFEIEVSVHCEVRGEKTFFTSTVKPQEEIVKTVVATLADHKVTAPKDQPEHTMGKKDGSFLQKVLEFGSKAYKKGSEVYRIGKEVYQTLAPLAMALI